ncbi:MAG: carbon starvation protein A, partial [Treponema sp.]|nr:carbon starvation protein A [Candidatus Treponema equi]
SLVSSGTTSKQLDKEKDAKPIAYGGMLLECVLAVLTLCAIAYARQTGHTKGATDIFAGGISAMCAKIPGCAGLENILYTLLVLTYSAFCLTSLDTATRLARFMFQEFWLEPGQTTKDITSGWKKVMVNPIFATVLTVVLGVALGLTGWQKIWGLFGASNQLLAGIGLLAVATWLGNIGKNNKMFLAPMAFMVVVTISSLAITLIGQVKVISAAKAAGNSADWGPYAQVILAAFMIVLSVILVIEGVTTLAKKKANA